MTLGWVIWLVSSIWVLPALAQPDLQGQADAGVRAINGRDFETLIAEIGLRRDQNNLSPLGPVSFGIKAGTFWEGGERLLNYQHLELAQTFPVDPDRWFRLAVLARDQQSLSSLLLGSTTFDLAGSYNQNLMNDDQLQLSFLARRREAGPESSFDEYQIGLG